MNKLLLVKVVRPVPPLATGSVPEIPLVKLTGPVTNRDVELSQFDKSMLFSLTCKTILLLTVATVNKASKDLIPLKFKVFLFVTLTNNASLAAPNVFKAGNKS